MKRVISMLLAALLMLPLVSCGQQEPAAVSNLPAASSDASASASSAETEKEPEPYIPSGTNPLTGEPMEEAYETLRPIAVMLNDLKAAQPQLGVSQADIIYEVPAEGGITRMMAVFQSLEGVGNLGSIRSARPYYLELALGHDALFVHAGGSPEAYADIPSWGVDNMDGVNGGSDAKIFWRDPERRKNAGYEHSLLTSGDNIQAYLNEGHFRTEHKSGYTYVQRFTDDGTPSGGTQATSVSVKYSYYKTATFDYSASAGGYAVGQYGGAYVDGNSGEQVVVTNVLVLETSVSVIAGDTYGRLAVKTTGTGNGTFFCGGQSIPIHWSRANRNSPFVYTTESGSPLVLGKGSSYVCILSPKTATVTVK